MSSQFPDPPGGGKYPITDIYKTFSPDALQQVNDYLSAINPLNLSLGNLRGFQGTGAMIVVERKELTASAASFDFTAIPQAFRHLRIVLYGRSDAAVSGEGARVRYNGDTGGNYFFSFVEADGSTVTAFEGLSVTSTSIGFMPGNTAGAGRFAVIEATIPFYTSGNRKSHISHGYQPPGGATFGGRVRMSGGLWTATDAVTRLTILPETGNFVSGSIATLYAHN